MDSIKIALRLDSENRFRLPKKLLRHYDDLEAEAWYELEITDKVKEPVDDVENDIVEEGAIGRLIAEKS